MLLMIRMKQLEFKMFYYLNGVIIINLNFICYLRKFLESKEISLRINDWFDLIFGVYQKGDKAKERNNLFSAYSYEEFEKTHNKEKDIKTKKYNARMIEFGLTQSNF